MDVKIDGERTSQVLVTISANGTVQGTITMSGTGGEYVTVRQTLGEFSGTWHFIKLFFVQGGMQIKNMIITRSNQE